MASFYYKNAMLVSQVFSEVKTLTPPLPSPFPSIPHLSCL